MIVKGIIKSIDFGSNTCMVRIPTWEPVGNPETVIPAVFSVTPGTFNGYKENDVVWVAFENSMSSHPVVIGKLYAGTNADKTEPRGVVNCQSLTVSDSAVLPSSTKITQATSEILDERNGLQVKTLEELISAVAENAATISNLVILEENPTLGNVIYSYAFSVSEVSVVQPTNADWDLLKGVADSMGLTNYDDKDSITSTATLNKDVLNSLTPEQLEKLSSAAQLWLTAGGEWKWIEGSTAKNWVPQTGYISEEDWINPENEYADAYPLLNVFKRTRSVYIQQGLDKVVITEELVRNPRTSYPTEYSLKMTADTHAGVNQKGNLYITAVKRFAGTLEEVDTEAYLWYWSPDDEEWVTPETEDLRYILNFEKSDFTSIITDRDLVVIATHTETFNPNDIKDGTKLPDPLTDKNLSTWLQLVANANVYEIETIPYSPLNTPVINLDNDSAALPYDEDGETVLYNNITVSTTASVYLNGEDISKDFTYTWFNKDGEIKNNTDVIEISNEGRTLRVGVADTYKVVAKKKDGLSSSYSAPADGLSKTFTVAKQLQGEAMMSSVITSSAGTSFNTKNLSTDTTTTLTAYLYRGTEDYSKDKDLYYEWYVLSSVPEEDGKEPTGQLIPEGEYELLDEDIKKLKKSIRIKNVATLRNKSVYFIAYTEKPSASTDTSAVLNVARLGITILGKN